jgi:hypothetical protein
MIPMVSRTSSAGISQRECDALNLFFDTRVPFLRGLRSIAKWLELKFDM